MLDTYCRPIYQKYCLDPLVVLLAKYKGLRPSHITVLAILSGVFAAACIVWQHWVLATVLIVLSGYCDSLDGTLARYTDCTSDTGATLDLLGDRLVEFLILWALFMIAPPTAANIVFAMLGASYLCVTTFLVVGVFSHNNSEKSFYYSVGLMERAEAFLFFVAMLWLPHWFTGLGIAYVILVLYTAIRRMLAFWARQSAC